MRKLRGFSLIETLLLIIIFVAAILAMQTYFKRAIAGKWKAAADSFGFGRQY